MKSSQIFGCLDSVVIVARKMYTVGGIYENVEIVASNIGLTLNKYSVLQDI